MRQKITKDFNGKLRVKSSELRLEGKRRRLAECSPSLSVGVSVECKLDVMYAGEIETLFMSLCMSQDEINIRKIFSQVTF